MASVEADALYMRHLLVYFEKDREQSLIDASALVNPYLHEAHELLTRYQIGGNGMPLSADPATQDATPAALDADTAMTATTSLARDGCIFIRRTGVILADGEVPTCGAPFVRTAGAINQATNFMDVWNGAPMREVRATLNTPAEWEQCHHCWYREGAYHQQRKAIAARCQPEMTRPTTFTEETWDFRKNDKTPLSPAKHDSGEGTT